MLFFSFNVLHREMIAHLKTFIGTEVHSLCFGSYLLIEALFTVTFTLCGVANLSCAKLAFSLFHSGTSVKLKVKIYNTITLFKLTKKNVFLSEIIPLKTKSLFFSLHCWQIWNTVTAHFKLMQQIFHNELSISSYSICVAFTSGNKLSRLCLLRRQ